MTVHSVLGIKVLYGEGDNVIAINDAAVIIDMPDGVTPNLRYQLAPDPFPDGDDFPLVDFEVPGVINAEIIGDPDTDVSQDYFGFATHGGGTSYVMDFLYYDFSDPTTTDIFFLVGGASLPDFAGAADPVAAWNSFESTVTAAGQVTSGPFAPGGSIPLSSAPQSTSYTGDEVSSFDAADNDISTGGGNDFVEVGGGGFDDVSTRDGNDFVRVDDSFGYTEAGVDLGRGNDILDLSEAANAYVVIGHYDDLTSGITARIDGLTGLARIDKGAAGETVVIDVNTVMNGGGLGLHGSSFADVLNVTASDGGFLQVRGLGGNDRINIGASDGTVRLDYRGAPAGIVANLETGTVQDGYGGTDTITGVVKELRGTMENDNITGSSRDERFILMAGNDTLDGGRGFDTARYDRSRVEAVTVDLEAGTATGVWRGESFSHSLAGIEAVYGSRDGDDLLSGDGAGNRLRGRGGDDTLVGRDGDDTLIGQEGDDSLDGGDGFDRAEFWGLNFADATITQLASGEVQVVSAQGTDILRDVEELGFDDTTILVNDLFPEPDVIVGGGGEDTLSGGEEDETLTSGGGDDTVDGGGGDDTIDGGSGNDVVRGGDGADSIDGGEGADTLNGGDGDDTIDGGSSDGDLRDVVYGGEGDDNIRGGAGNDLLFGMAGNDTLAGGRGADELQGQDGNDVITGSAFSDLVFGGAGDDFVNGGFGFDRINGGSGADKFFHVGVEGHGSDWVQDYSALEGDVLLFGGSGATADDFQVNFTHTASKEGERSGDDDVEEAFVIYKPTGQILWALVDGGGQDEINLQIGGDVFDLLA